MLITVPISCFRLHAVMKHDVHDLFINKRRLLTHLSQNLKLPSVCKSNLSWNSVNIKLYKSPSETINTVSMWASQTVTSCQFPVYLDRTLPSFCPALLPSCSGRVFCMSVKKQNKQINKQKSYTHAIELIKLDN